MRSIVIYSTSYDPEYEDAYSLLAGSIIRRKGSLFFVRPPTTYLGHGTFSEGCMVDEKGFHQTNNPVRGDIVFNKSLTFDANDTWVINHPVFNRACKKDRIAEWCGTHVAFSVTVSSQAVFDNALQNVPGEMVVLKPLNAYGGEGVWIGKRKDIPDMSKNLPLIVQEFVDTSGGIPNICSGRHDLRLIYIGSTLVDAYLRQPAGKGYLSNVAQGGKISHVPLTQVPDSAKEITAAIDHRARSFPDRVYSIDMGRHSDGSWKVFELNAPPGLPLPHERENVEEHYELLAEHLLTCERTTNPTILAD